MNQLLIICPLVFFAGFVDSIAGGGGIIALPAYYIAGVSPKLALGTNKFVSTFGTFAATAQYIRSKKINVRAALVSVPAALIGSALGAKLALVLSDVFLQYVLIISLPILAVFILTNKRFGDSSSREPVAGKNFLLLSGLAGFIIGAYDGFFGPGTGTFLILIFNAMLGLDLITASGNAKIVNLASNAAAFITFLVNGSIVFHLGIPAIIFSIAGNYLGSSIAIKNGARAIKPMFLLVFVLLLIKIIVDII